MADTSNTANTPVWKGVIDSLAGLTSAVLPGAAALNSSIKGSTTPNATSAGAGTQIIVQSPGNSSSSTDKSKTMVLWIVGGIVVVLIGIGITVAIMSNKSK